MIGNRFDIVHFFLISISDRGSYLGWPQHGNHQIALVTPNAVAALRNTCERFTPEVELAEVMKGVLEGCWVAINCRGFISFYGCNPST